MSATVRDIPAVAEMIDLGRRFVCWKYVKRKGKITKPPMRSDGRTLADSTDPTTWDTYEACAATVARVASIEGLGPVLGDLGDGRHLVGVDLDNGIDPETGKPRPWAREAIDDLNTYTEISPSGTGFKAYCLVDRLPPLPSKKLVIREAADEHHHEQIEVFPAGRYFCLTGQHLDGTPDTLEDATEAFARLAHRLAAAKAGEKGAGPKSDGPEAEIDSSLPPKLLALLASDDKLRRAWTKGTKLGKGKDKSASGLDMSLTLYLCRKLDNADLDLALRDYPFGQIGGGTLKGEAAERRIKQLIAIAEKGREAVQHNDTQDGIAQAFADLHQHKARYCHTAGAWFFFNNAIWRRDERRLAYSWTRQIGRTLGFDGKASTASGAEKFAQSDERLSVTHETWDPDPFLIGTPEGVVDLRTAKLRLAEAEDFITRSTAVAPRPGAHPLWSAFLEDATRGDQGLQRFLQQIAGYALTGDTREHALFFIYGPGGNGKGVFLNVLIGILADYATTAAMDTFTATHSDRHPTDLAMLNGARLVTASETEEGRPWAEARIKQLTGGDPITARFMRRDFFTYLPSFKLVIIGNHKPALRNVDDAARRRFNIIPFEHKPTRPDMLLGEKLKAEWPQILQWAIDGCLDWQRNGLVRPRVVAEATAEYFEDQNLFAQWLGECCSLHPSVSEKGSALYQSWRAYAEGRGARPGDAKSFGENLRREGFEKRRPPRIDGRRPAEMWHGLQLTAEAQADEQTRQGQRWEYTL